MLPAARLRPLLESLCAGAGIDLAGAVALPVELPHGPAWLDWLDAGRHGGLEYLSRGPRRRADPGLGRSWARTVLVFAQRYVRGWSADGGAAGGGWLDGVSRYARGADYHDVLGAAVRKVLAGLRSELERDVGKAARSLRAHVGVDAGPYLERELAWLAGLGFFGRNTCLIHPALGSGFFLAVAAVEFAVPGLESAPAPLVGPPTGAAAGGRGAMPSLCGECTRCLDACPTGALIEPFVLDAGRCVSTWSIEWRGGAPAEHRDRQGGMLFGCDICQAVCPWNHKSLRRAIAAEADADAAAADPAEGIGPYAADSRHGEIGLGDLICLDAAGFRDRFRRTPLWRAHPEGLRRNALVVAANTGRDDLADRIEAAAAGGDAHSAGVAAWALRRLAAAKEER